jgi:hypothetical protein
MGCAGRRGAGAQTYRHGGNPGLGMNVSLHIGHLVLDNLPMEAGQGPVLQSALERELVRLLGQGGWDGLSGGAVPHLSMPAIHLSASGQPAELGRKIARALCDGLAPTPALSLRLPPHPFPNAAATGRGASPSPVRPAGAGTRPPQGEGHFSGGNALTAAR